MRTEDREKKLLNESHNRKFFVWLHRVCVWIYSQNISRKHVHCVCNSFLLFLRLLLLNYYFWTEQKLQIGIILHCFVGSPIQFSQIALKILFVLFLFYFSHLFTTRPRNYEYCFVLNVFFSLARIFMSSMRLRSCATQNLSTYICVYICELFIRVVFAAFFLSQ